jgi:hypothetical protein
MLTLKEVSLVEVASKMVARDFSALQKFVRDTLSQSASKRSTKSAKTPRVTTRQK